MESLPGPTDAITELLNLSRVRTVLARLPHTWRDFSLSRRVFPEMQSADAQEESNRSSDASDIDEIERNKVAIMRALIEREDASAKDEDDLTLKRFLIARDLDIEKASTLFFKYLRWRHTFVPNGFISATEIPNELAQNKMFAQGFDKNRRPILLVFGSRHHQTSGGLEEFKRFVVFTLDKICSRIPREQEKFVCIADLKGWGYANSDMRGYLAALSILQDCYPERLGKLYMVHAPRIFMAVWKILYPFIDARTKKKIVFVERKPLPQTLLRDIDNNELPDLYGGKLQLVPIQNT